MSWNVKGFLELVRFTISKLDHCYNPSVSKRSSSSFPPSNAHPLFLNWISYNFANFAISLLSWMSFYTVSGHIRVLLYYSEFPFNVLLQKLWAQWEMHLWPVEWFTVSTAMIQSPRPSTLLTTPRLEGNGIPTFSSPISSATTPWWPTTPEKKCCTPGTASVWSLIPSRLRNVRLITWSAGDRLEKMLIRDALVYKDDEKTRQFTASARVLPS